MSVCQYKTEFDTNNNDDFCEVKLYKQVGGQLPVITNLKSLIDELDRIFECDKVNIDLVHYVMKSYKSNPLDWKKYAKFDRYRCVITFNYHYNHYHYYKDFYLVLIKFLTIIETFFRKIIPYKYVLHFSPTRLTCVLAREHSISFQHKIILCYLFSSFLLIYIMKKNYYSCL